MPLLNCFKQHLPLKAAANIDIDLIFTRNLKSFLIKFSATLYVFDLQLVILNDPK